jgi:chromatin segregation and condensation protein Rec8/ScpA/Scc1 (kleisin family)
MQKSHSQDSYTIELSKPQLELLEKLLCQEIAKHEAGTSAYRPQLLKSTHQKFWTHIKPSPAEKQARLEDWVRSIYKKRAIRAFQSLAR